MRRLDADTLDRARGALLGLAVGDALGTTLEFKEPGTFWHVNDMVGGGPFRLRAGQWTDDTSMALCLAESLLECGGHDPVDQMQRYVRWWKEGHWSSTGACFDIGSATRLQLARFIHSGEPHDPDVNEESAANGSLMRLAPVSIRWFRAPREVQTFAAASSRPTHPARRPMDACRVLAGMTAALIRGRPADEVFGDAAWKYRDLHPEVAAVANGSWRSKEPPAIRGTGFCVASLEAAIGAVAFANNFRDAVLRAVNLGDDADTTGAIAGQLAGARWGASGLPAEWLDKLTAREAITEMADGLHNAAVGEQQGSASQSLWAHDDALHAWWVEPGRFLAGEYPFSKDASSGEGKLCLLADAGIRTIVDLTTPEDRLLAYKNAWRQMGEAAGAVFRHVAHPIPDLGVIDDEGYAAIRRTISGELAAGRPVYVHCWGGVGRTATVVGMCLMADGRTGTEALEQIVHLRAGTLKAGKPAPETDVQRMLFSRAGYR